MEQRDNIEPYIIAYQLREMGVCDDDEIIKIMREQTLVSFENAVAILSDYYEHPEEIKMLIKRNVSKRDLQRFQTIMDEKILSESTEEKPAEWGDD